MTVDFFPPLLQVSVDFQFVIFGGWNLVDEGAAGVVVLGAGGLVMMVFPFRLISTWSI